MFLWRNLKPTMLLAVLAPGRETGPEAQTPPTAAERAERPPATLSAGGSRSAAVVPLRRPER